MTDAHSADLPSTFVQGWAMRLASTRGEARVALDLACGGGRHVCVLARAGYRVTGLDIRLDALRDTRTRLDAEGLRGNLACTDLTRWPMPRGRFHVIVVSRYLDRLLFPALVAGLAPGGVLLYETFTERQLDHPTGPRSPHHLLRPGELRMHMGGLDILFDEEVTRPSAMARIAARRPFTPGER